VEICYIHGVSQLSIRSILGGMHMNEVKITQNNFENFIKEAIAYIKKYEYKEAYQFIMSAINTDPNRPEPQNLLGIWYELRGDDSLARKHYRMAYVLDPVYKPASANLERVATLFPINAIPIDYGEVIEDENLKLETNVNDKAKVKVNAKSNTDAKSKAKISN
jgi:tetratricopeptide (TPR) repeat protein